MLNHAQEAMTIMQSKTRQDLDSDRLLNLAIVRLLEIIGEAASRIPKEDCCQYPTIPWHAIISMRNRLIHNYGNVDLDIVWQVVSQDLPKLTENLIEITTRD
ncbi:DUF86 domain-containing protein [Spirulina subsalsa]|uniref:HepT-like ribonuclease domain-containing protein n=1 Tax=Spirulina subsalsa TaxID=54311 RepID=UPI00037340FF|nr:HepT-like ribonuclease domain-containing protein [Spirulina subsalsa]